MCFIPFYSSLISFIRDSFICILSLYIRVSYLLYEFQFFYTSSNSFICVSSLFIWVPYLLYEFQLCYLRFIPFYSSFKTFVQVSIFYLRFIPFYSSFISFIQVSILLFAFHPFLSSFISFSSFYFLFKVLILFNRVSYLLFEFRLLKVSWNTHFMKQAAFISQNMNEIPEYPTHRVITPRVIKHCRLL